MEESKDKPHAPVAVKTVKKRKRPPKHNCDKNCALCRMPCDNPINPQAVRKLT